MSKSLAISIAMVLCISACAGRGTADEADAPGAEEAPAVTAEPALPATVQPVESAEPAEPAEPSAPTALPPGDHLFAVSHGSRDRLYRVYVPDQVSVPAPVVIALHGGGGTGEAFQQQNGMDIVADREGFIVIYPEGTGLLGNRLLTWNSGFNCCGYSLDNNVDDVGFLRAVIEDAAIQVAIDRGRVYMTGHSNGAMMAYRFAAEAADMVTAIVPVAGALSVMDPDPSHAVPLLHIHSVDDPRALYDGGAGPPFPGTRRTHVAEPVMPGIETWAARNGCSPGGAEVDSISGSRREADQTAVRVVWDCPDEASVEHLRLSGSGHGWPGVSVPRFIQTQLGPPTTLVNASEEIWAFVSRYSRS